MTAYQNSIRPYIHSSIDPRHVEAWMRSEHGTLDSLSREQFIDAILAAEDCIKADAELSEKLAQSYGL